jgi:predicted nucleic acid-binding protein
MVMTTVRRVFIDTNVLTRATIDVAPLHQTARALLDQFWEQRVELVISHQVIREYVANATRPQTYSPALPVNLVLKQVADFRQIFTVYPDTPPVLTKLLELLGQVAVGGKQVHDANIVASMLTFGVTELLTHNVTDFDRYSRFITVIPLIEI